MSSTAADRAVTRWTDEAMQSALRKRYRPSGAFKFARLRGRRAFRSAFLAFLLDTMIWKGAGGLTLDFLHRLGLRPTPATVGVWGALKGSFLTIS